MEKDEIRLRELIHAWHDATRAGDLDAVLALMADDAVFLTPGKPPMTRQEFAARFRGFAGKVSLETRHDIREIWTSGDLGYCWAELSLSMGSPEGGVAQRAGHVLTVFRRFADGRWLLYRDANMLAPVA